MQTVPGLRRVRRLRLMTLHDLSVASGCSQNTIVRLEAGKPAWPRTIKRLAAALDVEPAELLREE